MPERSVSMMAWLYLLRWVCWKIILYCSYESLQWVFLIRECITSFWFSIRNMIITMSKNLIMICFNGGISNFAIVCRCHTCSNYDLAFLLPCKSLHCCSDWGDPSWGWRAKGSRQFKPDVQIWVLRRCHIYVCSAVSYQLYINGARARYSVSSILIIQKRAMYKLTFCLQSYQMFNPCILRKNISKEDASHLALCDCVCYGGTSNNKCPGTMIWCFLDVWWTRAYFKCSSEFFLLNQLLHGTT